MSEKLNQSEIDLLVNHLHTNGTVDISPEDAAQKFKEKQEATAPKLRALIAARKRYIRTLEMAADQWEIKEARHHLHVAAFNLWLVNHDILSKDWKVIVNKNWDEWVRSWIKRGCPDGGWYGHAKRRAA